MLLYLLFWTILGFIFHFYIIFGTNLLTGGPAQNCCFFAYFRVSKKRNIKRSPNGMKPSETWFSHQIRSRRLGPYVKEASRKPRGRGHLPPWARPPPSWDPCCSTGVLLPPIYTYVPPNNQIWSKKPNSTAATFCIHEMKGPVPKLRRRGHRSWRASTSSSKHLRFSVSSLLEMYGSIASS